MGGQQQQRSSLLQQQQQHSQQSLMGANTNISPMPRGSSKSPPGPIQQQTKPIVPQPMPIQGQPIPQQQQVQQPMITTSDPSSAAAALAAPTNAIPSMGHRASSSSASPPTSNPSPNTTRVVPVSISPRCNSTILDKDKMAENPANLGGVSDAALIYTKYALQSIVTSLNERAKTNSNGDTKQARVYTIRDLSTCLGAWDLSIPASSSGCPNSPGNKRQKLDTNEAGIGAGAAAAGGGADRKNDGNADTAFTHYYERSCPILLDAKSETATPLPFCVEDFGDRGGGNNAFGGGGLEEDNGECALPVVAGAVVLTYGADSKFTGGIGEEGVLTKAIVEFFSDEAVVLPNSDEKEDTNKMEEDKNGKEKKEEGQQKHVDEDAMVEAEEQIFARVDPSGGGGEEQDSLITAALFALSPSPADKSSSAPSSSSSDNGVYIPTIWSGNTDRIYQYCLLGNFDDNGKERASKRLCVAIQKKTGGECANNNQRGPAKGVCRITLTLSPASVLAKKKLMVKEEQDKEANEVTEESSPLSTGSSACTSEVHRMIRQCLRILRPPKLMTVVDPNTNDEEMMMGSVKRRRQALRRRSVTHQLIDPTLIVVGVRCQHELLLDANEVGKIYVNGALVVDCYSSLAGKATRTTSMASSTNASHGLHRLGADALPAHTLFGVDFTLNSNNSSGNGGLPNKLVLEREYGALLVDALIFGGQSDADVAGKLLSRLISGNTEKQTNAFDDVDEVNDENKATTGQNGSGGGVCCSGKTSNERYRTESNYSIQFDNISHPCLESIVLSSSIADPVGIGAKALGTKFRWMYGGEAFPCEVGTNDEYRLHRILGAHKIAKAVPRRARDVLLRGGYLHIDRMASLLWGRAGGGSGGAPWDSNHSDVMRAAEAMEGAIKLLGVAGCRDVKPNKIRFVARKKLEPSVVGHDGVCPSSTTLSKKHDPSISNLRCWYDSSSGTFYVCDAILFREEEHDVQGDDGEGSVNSAKMTETVSPMPDESKPEAEQGAVKSPPPPSSEQGDATKEAASLGGVESEQGTVKSPPQTNSDQDDATKEAASSGGMESKLISCDDSRKEVEEGGAVSTTESTTAKVNGDKKEDGESKAVSNENNNEDSKKESKDSSTAGAEGKAGDCMEEPTSSVRKMDVEIMDVGKADGVMEEPTSNLVKMCVGTTASTEGKPGDSMKEPTSNVANMDVEKMDVTDEKVKSDIANSDVVKESTDVASAEPEDDVSKNTPDQTKTESKTESNDGKKLAKQIPRPASGEDAAYLLAFYIAKEHPDAMVLERFVTTCHRCS